MMENGAPRRGEDLRVKTVNPKTLTLKGPGSSDESAPAP